jgi:hypothetical protein
LGIRDEVIISAKASAVVERRAPVYSRPALKKYGDGLGGVSVGLTLPFIHPRVFVYPESQRGYSELVVNPVGRVVIEGHEEDREGEEDGLAMLAHLPDFNVKSPKRSTPCSIARSMKATLAGSSAAEDPVLEAIVWGVADRWWSKPKECPNGRIEVR